MKIHYFIILITISFSISSCFVIPMLIVNNQVENSDKFNYNEVSGYEGTYLAELDGLTYTLELALSGVSFDGTILVKKEEEIIEDCEFFKSRQRNNIPGLRATLTCDRPDEEVSGGFSFEINERDEVMTIFGVDGSLDLAVPNNLELKKVALSKK